MRTTLRGLAVACLMALAMPVLADEGQQAQQLIDSLQFRSGQIEVGPAHAEFNLGTQFRYLDKADARKQEASRAMEAERAARRAARQAERAAHKAQRQAERQALRAAAQAKAAFLPCGKCMALWRSPPPCLMQSRTLCAWSRSMRGSRATLR